MVIFMVILKKDSGVFESSNNVDTLKNTDRTENLSNILYFRMNEGNNKSLGKHF